ncbi:hypothetical protein A5821_000359 [Enterococcus sp. 7F3_DIV0205]|uniref:DUF3887 domain-containing protein n=1 Tax=Candidatus Enterococcus palustris TaxID=1834189 RepID=A0AAQ3W6A3_9ENTE|nr:DUF3887 domain-containing protein [Enterococcus sp. 7F3_DIV0205]OTN84772.1 hypothetical protein A5821_000701 [Enterococcus sp. 7F3_DIV0205]
MKKIISSMIIIFTGIMLLAACGEKVDQETSTKMTAKAEEVVSLINDGDYEKASESFSDQLLKQLNKTDFEAVVAPLLKKSGNFEKFEKSTVEKKDGFYVVVLVAKYEKDKRVFTISINEKEKLEGFFIK